MNFFIAIGYYSEITAVSAQVTAVVVWVFNSPFPRLVIAFFVDGPLAEVFFKAIEEVGLKVAHVVASGIAGPIQHRAV